MPAPRPPRSTGRPPATQDEIDEDLFDDDTETGGQPRGAQDRQKRLLLGLLGKWYWIALGLALGLLCGLYYLDKTPKLYSATTTLLLKQNLANVLTRGPEMSETIDLRSVEGMNTVAERLRRPELLERVANRPDIRSLPNLMPPETDYRPEWYKKKMDTGAPAEPTTVPPPPALAGAISYWTTVSVRKNTRLLDLTVTHPVPEVAQALADAIGQEYIAELVGSRSEGRTSSTELLMREAEQARTKLQTAENASSIYKSALELHKVLEVKEAEVEELSRRYRAKHPKLIAGRAQLTSLQTRFLEEFNAARLAPMDKAYWEANSGALPAGLATGTAGGEANAPEASEKSLEAVKVARRMLVARTSVLQSEIASQTTVFNAINIRIQETGINQQAPESEVEISSRARKPGMPSAPVPTKVIAASCAGGIVLGLAIALLALRLDNRFHTVAQVESETELPIIAAIGAMTPRDVAVAVKKSIKQGMASGPSTPPGWNPMLVFRPELTHTHFVEQFRVLRTSISLLGNERRRRVTLFTSALPGEGKSLVSANYALAAAHQGNKTLLIDMDLRKPNVHRQFGLPRTDERHAGLTRVLAGQSTLLESVLTDTGAENLHMLLTGPKAPSPGELLDTHRIQELLDEAAQHYDTIVLDTAPLLAVPDTRLIAPLVHNLCLVVRAEYVPKGAVMRALDLLESGDTKPSGIVFNGFVERKHLIGQNYSYGAYRTNRYGKPYGYGQGNYGAYGQDDDGK